MKVIAQPRPRFDVWFRNPRLYWQQLQDEGVRAISFDYAFTKKYRINPPVWMRTHFGMNEQWRVMSIGQFYAQMWTDVSGGAPAAVYPVWSASSDQWHQLEALADRPIAERPDMQLMERQYRPIPGQDHVIVVTDLPNLHELSGKQFMRDLSEFQTEHMDCTLFIHGAYSFANLFGLEFQMGDHESRELASKKSCFLPAGGILRDVERIKDQPFWAELLGFKPNDLIKSPDARCRFNIRAAVWAGTYYRRYIRFGFGRRANFSDKEMQRKIFESKAIYSRRLVARPGDRVVCDDCSLWLACKYYREGAVCIVTNTSTKKIADLFGTRDAGSITDALSRVLRVQLERAEGPLQAEATSGEIDPELNKLMNTIFKDGVELLRIVDPSFRQGGKPNQVQLTLTNQQPVNPEDAKKQLVQDAVLSIEQSGTPRDQITAAMIEDWVRTKYGEQKARELTAG